MASLQQDPSGVFHICFRYGKQRFKRSLQTTDNKKATAATVRVSENLRMVSLGRMEIPDDADVPTFLLSDGVVASKPQPICILTLSELFPKYLDSIPEGAIEKTSVETNQIHMKHFVRVLGKNKPLRSLTASDLQKYVTTRSREDGRRGNNVSAATIRKEIATLGSLWNWAVAQGLITGNYPRRGIVFPKHSEKPPFQTVTQILRQIEQGGLNEEQAGALWACLYLNVDELNQVLDFIKLRSPHPYLYPMVFTAMHTGARRSELCRTLVNDLDLKDRTLLIRERKRMKSRKTTRSVPVSGALATALQDWLKVKPASPFLFLDPTVNGFTNDPKNEFALDPYDAGYHLTKVLDKGEWKHVGGWHVFRHSFISNCATKNVDQRFIDNWVGHQTDEQRRRYRHLFPDSQKQAIDSVFSS